MRHDYSFEGEHIYLIPMNEDTSEQYRRLRNREDNRGFFFNSAVIEKEQQEKWFGSYLKKESECMFAVFLDDTKEFIGGIGIYDIDHLRGTAEVGRIIIDRNLVSGKGYGAEAIIGITEIARHSLELTELYAYIYTDNIASTKAFLRAGFSKCLFDDENSGVIKVKLILG